MLLLLSLILLSLLSSIATYRCYAKRKDNVADHIEISNKEKAIKSLEAIVGEKNSTIEKLRADTYELEDEKNKRITSLMRQVNSVNEDKKNELSALQADCNDSAEKSYSRGKVDGAAAKTCPTCPPQTPPCKVKFDNQFGDQEVEGCSNIQRWVSQLSVNSNLIGSKLERVRKQNSELDSALAQEKQTKSQLDTENKKLKNELELKNKHNSLTDVLDYALKMDEINGNWDQTIAVNDFWLSENKKKTGVFTLESGLQYKVKKSAPPNSKSPLYRSQCECFYTTQLIDGTQVFSPGTAEISPSQSIPAWKEALQMMGEGDVWTLYVPGNLAYGSRRNWGKIKPGTVLVFDISLIKVIGSYKLKERI